MIQDIAPKKFDNQYYAAIPEKEDIVLVFTGTNRRDDKVCVRQTNNGIVFPTVGEIGEAGLIYLFSIDERKFFLRESTENIPEAFSFEELRILRKSEPVYMCFAGMTAYHLFSWYRNSHFCGRCGAETVHDLKLRMKQCPKCGSMHFPVIAPAVIIGLRNGDSLMMSRYAGREYKGRALLAGFCEIGETPEQTVVREVMEEVGLKAKNVTYYGSQPWGFDSNLLLGFFADLDGDDTVSIDTEELASAGFVKREDIEYEPNLFSLTATMIEDFRIGKW